MFGLAEDELSYGLTAEPYCKPDHHAVLTSIYERINKMEEAKAHAFELAKVGLNTYGNGGGMAAIIGRIEVELHELKMAERHTLKKIEIEEAKAKDGARMQVAGPRAPGSRGQIAADSQRGADDLPQREHDIIVIEALQVVTDQAAKIEGVTLRRNHGAPTLVAFTLRENFYRDTCEDDGRSDD